MESKIDRNELMKITEKGKDTDTISKVLIYVGIGGIAIIVVLAIVLFSIRANVTGEWYWDYEWYWWEGYYWWDGWFWIGGGGVLVIFIAGLSRRRYVHVRVGGGSYWRFWRGPIRSPFRGPFRPRPSPNPMGGRPAPRK